MGPAWAAARVIAACAGLHLLTNDQVQKDLHLTDEQRVQILSPEHGNAGEPRKRMRAKTGGNPQARTASAAQTNPPPSGGPRRPEQSRNGQGPGPYRRAMRRSSRPAGSGPREGARAVNGAKGLTTEERRARMPEYGRSWSKCVKRSPTRPSRCSPRSSGRSSRRCRASRSTWTPAAAARAGQESPPRGDKSA